jgi:hypothetical protein
LNEDIWTKNGLDYNCKFNLYIKEVLPLCARNMPPKG